MPRIGHVGEADGVLDEMEESLNTNVRIVVIQNSIAKSRRIS